MNAINSSNSRVPGDEPCNVGVIGLGVMASNLILNITDHHFRVAVYNRTAEKVDTFLHADETLGRPIFPCSTITQVAQRLTGRRIILLMLTSGDPIPTTEVRLFPELSPIDAAITELCQTLAPGDVIMDGGNTHVADTERRAKFVKQFGVLYVGCGVSGGSAGARRGPSIMPGGDQEAWDAVRPLLESIAARTGPECSPCVAWIGPGGAGHYVKIIHNGIEYGNMQMLCEAFWMLRHVAGMTNSRLHEQFDCWTRTPLNSYLLEITRDILRVPDPETNRELVDLILDQAEAKGTGKWMSQLALDLGVPSTLVTVAVQARALSAMKQLRCRASTILAGQTSQFQGARDAFVNDLYQAVFASTICSYAQGFVQLRAAAAEYDWRLNLPSIASIWRDGCIIRAELLDPIRMAFQQNPELENLLLAPHFVSIITGALPGWRRIVSSAADLGIPAPAISAALTYYDTIRAADLPANMAQAQRDYFGEHGYYRIDKPGEGPFHTDWQRLLRTIPK